MKRASLIIGCVPLESDVKAYCVPNDEIDDDERAMLVRLHGRFLDLRGAEDEKMQRKIWTMYLNGKWKDYRVPAELTQITQAKVNGKTYVVATEDYGNGRFSNKNSITKELEAKKIKITNVYHFAENC